MVRVRFPLPAPGRMQVMECCLMSIEKVGAGCAHIAQSVEHFLGKEEVTGSSPVMSSKIFKADRQKLVLLLVLTQLSKLPKRETYHG